MDRGKNTLTALSAALVVCLVSWGISLPMNYIRPQLIMHPKFGMSINATVYTLYGISIVINFGMMFAAGYIVGMMVTQSKVGYAALCGVTRCAFGTILSFGWFFYYTSIKHIYSGRISHYVLTSLVTSVTISVLLGIGAAVLGGVVASGKVHKRDY